MNNRTSIPLSITPDQGIDIALRISWPMRKHMMTYCQGYVGQGKTTFLRLAGKELSSLLGLEFVDMRQDDRQLDAGEHFAYLEVNTTGMQRWDFQMPFMNHEDATFDMYVLSQLKRLTEGVHAFVVWDEAMKSPELNAIFAQLGRERTLGWTHKVSDETCFFLTGNREGDGADAYALTTDVNNRSMGLNVVGTAQSFVEHEGDNLEDIISTASLFFGGGTEKHPATNTLFDYGDDPTPVDAECTFRSMKTFNDIIRLKGWEGANGEFIKGWDWQEPHLRCAGAGVIGVAAFSTLAASTDLNGELTSVLEYMDDPEAHREQITSIFVENSLGFDNINDFKFTVLAKLVNRVNSAARIAREDDSLSLEETKQAIESAFETAALFVSIIGDGEMTNNLHALAYISQPELQNTDVGGAHRLKSRHG